MQATFADRLRNLMEQRNLGYTAIARGVGVSRQTVYNWLERDRITRRNLDSLAEFLGVDPQWLQYGISADGPAHSDSSELDRLAAAVVERLPEGVMLTDLDQRITYVNPAFSLVTGYSAEEVMGRTPHLLQSGHHDEEFYRTMWRSLERDGFWRGEIWNRRKTGETYPEIINIHVLKDADDQPLRYIAIFSDVSLQEHMRERLHDLSCFDSLTGLPNRALLLDRLELSLAQAKGNDHGAGVLLLDLDRFKNVNDGLGHSVGDRLLTQVAARLRRVVGKADVVARLGGDEFLILLPKVRSREGAVPMAQDLLRALDRPFSLAGRQLFLNASIGIALYPEDGADAEGLLRHADVALHRAKESRPGSFLFYEKHMGERFIERFALENDLRQAIDERQIRLVFQPQVDTSSGHIVGFEALARWTHPERGNISPDVFIPIAEETGLIVQLGNFVLEQACRAARRWQDVAGRPIRVAVNLSAIQVCRPDLCEIVADVLERSGLDPHLLELEITETTLMTNVETAAENLRRLGHMGVQLAIDDFGTGYSSLSYLKRFAIDRLKIDRSFVRDIPRDRDDMEIAATVIAMGRNLRLRVVAEGVEQPEQLEQLRRLGCDEYQGFLFSEPIELSETANLLLNRTIAEPI